MKIVIVGVVLALGLVGVPLAHAKGAHGHGSGGHSAHGGGSNSGGTHGHAGGSAVPRGGGVPSTRTSTAQPPTPPSHHPHPGHAPTSTAVPRTGGITPMITPPPTIPAYRLPLYVLPFGFGGGVFPFYRSFGWPWWYGSTFSTYAGSYMPGPTPMAPPPYGTAAYPIDPHGPSGGLRLKIDPDLAEVWVDGYFAGVIHIFEGHFHRAKLSPGPHHGENRAPGFPTLQFDIVIVASRTVTYRGTLGPVMP